MVVSNFIHAMNMTIKMFVSHFVTVMFSSLVWRRNTFCFVAVSSRFFIIFFSFFRQVLKTRNAENATTFFKSVPSLNRRAINLLLKILPLPIKTTFKHVTLSHYDDWTQFFFHLLLIVFWYIFLRKIIYGEQRKRSSLQTKNKSIHTIALLLDWSQIFSFSAIESCGFPFYK